jgi:glutamate carboxypeptidase
MLGKLCLKTVATLLYTKEKGINMNLHTVIENLQEKYIAVWEDVCNIESPTSDKSGVDNVGEYFIRLATAQGWEVEIFEQSVAGNVVCITMNPRAGLSPVTFSGHIDTVHPKGMFGYPAVSMDDEKIYGPGVVDCKGGVVAGFLAMEALAKVGFVNRPVRMLLQSDEEVGSRLSNKATINYICEKAKDSIAFFNLEGHNNGDACLGRKGIITFEFTVVGQEAHSSACAVRGANAILDAAYKIIELEKIKDDDGLTCNCGVISGGTVKNTVPGKCVFTADVRYATQEQYDWICEYIKNLANTVHVAGCKCTVEIFGGRPAMVRAEKNIRLFERMNEIYEKNGMSTLKERNRNGGSDAAEVTQAGIPCVECMGVKGGGMHCREEFAFISSLGEAAERLARVVLDI